MTFVTTEPEAMLASSGELTGIGAAMAGAHGAAAAPTTTVLPAGLDEVSALTALVFNTHGAAHQADAAEGMAVHAAHVATLEISADSYAVIEAINLGGLL